MKYFGDKAEAFAANPIGSVWAVLAFGDDEGVANDAARELVRAWTGHDPDPEIVSLDEDTVRKDDAALFDALEARSLLGSMRLIRLRVSGDKIAGVLGDALKEGDHTPGRFEAKLVVSSGPLQKRSKLRASFEAATHAASLQFPADAVDDVAALCSEMLQSHGIEIEADALDLLSNALPGHRRLVHQELDKLALYAHRRSDPLALSDVRALVAGDADADAAQFVDALFDRNGARALSELDRLTLTGTGTITLLRAIQRDANRMLAVAALGPNASPDAGMKLRPPVYKAQWSVFSGRLRRWPASHLTRLLERIYDLELSAKQAGGLADTELRSLVTQITGQASGTS